MYQYEQFMEEIRERLVEQLNNGREEYKIKIVNVPKNNGIMRKGLNVEGKQETVSSVYYLENNYRDYLDGESVDTIVKNILNDLQGQSYDHIYNHFNLQDAKDRIYYSLINEKENQNYLKDKPYKEMEDLAVIYKIRMSDNNEFYTTTITKNLMDSWGIDQEELHNIAEKNTPQLLPMSFRPLSDVIPLLSEEEGPAFYVLSNDQLIEGASAILYPGVKEAIYKQLGGDYYVVPSSIHETLILKKSEEFEGEELNNIIRSVNETLDPTDILGDHVYEVREGKELVPIFSVEDNFDIAYEKFEIHNQERQEQSIQESANFTIIQM
ncbi:DUF5688 family protein [Diplocloster hominis]|uniref:DUF5688 family protein n=1 Tax=Diplocloster hominis TaxID=3079010 RepID=UPI0031BA8351